jgi:hypothetical protein
MLHCASVIRLIRRAHSRVLYIASCLVICGGVATDLAAQDTTPNTVPDTEERREEFFQQQVLPLLQQYCFECHSHAADTLQGGLALDYRSGWEIGGDRGPALRPGEPQTSLFMQAVRRQDGLEMPPDAPLPADAIAVFEQWIRAGAFDPRVTPPPTTQQDWWSLRPLARPTVPDWLHVAQPDTQPTALQHTQPDTQETAAEGPIDAFIRNELSVRGLTPSPAADRRTLYRRLSIDLLGLPPTAEEVQAFEADERPDAYERLVDRLLSKPAHGERWARHWMDTIHFAESHGFEHDVARPHAWPYRDYLIERLNTDVPWSRFVREQLAADVFYADQPQYTPALGFLGAGTFDISSLTTAPMNFAYLDRDDMLSQTIGALASTTVNCARCHAHKFDPISQDDYFALQAVFAGVIKGDIAYDADPQVAARRQELEALRASVAARDPAILLSAAWQPQVLAWEQAARTEATLWHVCEPESYFAESTGGASTPPAGSRLQRLEDASLLASAPYPPSETFTITFRPPTSRVTAVRVEVLTDPSLPHHGPGTAVNGNLHLSEISVRTVASAAAASEPLKLLRAVADFDQEGWTAAHAIDGNPATAWGIHPQEGRPHAIFVELAEPLELGDSLRLEVQLQQAHGREHTLGRFRLATSDQPNSRLIAIAEEVLAALAIEPAERTPEQQLAIAVAALQGHVDSELARLPAPQRVYAAAPRVLEGNGAAAQNRDRPQTIHVLQRGELGKPLREVGPGALSVVSDLPARFEDLQRYNASEEAARRAALADWLVALQNPLTWRSIANRLWHYHFGRGLCDTPNDFGRMGGEVSHPQLLDWLACELRDAGQSLKWLHRRIVTSHTYRQRSDVHHAQAAEIDGDNRGWWRQNRQRLDADSYRDAVLAVSGRLDATLGGPSIQHFSTRPGAQLTPILDYSTFDWNSPQAGRRSIYRFVWRGIADPFMEALDFPDLGMLTPQRSASASPLQALALLNNDFVLFHSQQLAAHSQRVAHPSPSTALTPTTTPGAAPASPGTSSPGTSSPIPPDSAVAAMFRVTLQRAPTEAEQQLFVPLAEQYGLPLVARMLLNSNEFLFLD